MSGSQMHCSAPTMDDIIIECAHWRGRVCVARYDVAPELRFQRRVDGLLTRVKPFATKRHVVAKAQRGRMTESVSSHIKVLELRKTSTSTANAFTTGEFSHEMECPRLLFYFPMAPCQEGERAERLTNTLPGAKHGGRHRRQCTSASMSLRRMIRRCSWPRISYDDMVSGLKSRYHTLVYVPYRRSLA